VCKKEKNTQKPREEKHKLELDWIEICRSRSRRHDNIPVQKVNFKIPSVVRSKMRRSTTKDVVRTNHIFILKTKSTSIIRLRKSFEKSLEIRQDSSQTKRDKRTSNMYNVQWRSLSQEATRGSQQMSFSAAEKIRFLVDFSFVSPHFGEASCAGLKSYFSAKTSLNTARSFFPTTRQTVVKKAAGRFVLLCGKVLQYTVN